MAQSSITVRPAKPEDIPRIRQIQIHYVLNTVITFQLEPMSEEQFLEKLQTLYDRNLPYIVAENDDVGILGFITASPYRFEGAYFPTAEIGLYCAHDQVRKGIGPKLLTKLQEVLREPKKHPEYFKDPEARARSPIKSLLAYMAIDEEGPKRGLALKDFYERYGFVDGGTITQVGYKFGRW